MADHHKAQSAKQTNEAAHQRRGVEPVHQAWTRLEQADQATLQRAVANPGLARPDDILGLQRAYGNQAITRLIQAFAPSTALGTGRTGGTGKLRVQAKLMVGPVRDQYEQEADRVAEQVMSMPNPQTGSRQPSLQRQAPEEVEEVQTKPLAASITPLVQRQAEEEEEIQAKPLAQRQDIPEEEEIQTKPLVQRQEVPEEEELQMKPALQPSDKLRTRRQVDGSFEASNSLEQRLDGRKGGGSPLSDDVRAFMEPRFGADFGGVRVHTGDEAVQLTRELSAQAFTHGQHIYLGEGRYDHGSTEGRRLLAHELTHTVQQMGGIRQQRGISGTDAGGSVTSPYLLQRATLSPEQLVGALQNIDIIHKKLESDKVRGQRMLDHVRSVLQKYQTLFPSGYAGPTSDAMMLTMVLDGVARVIAEELNDPSVQPKVASALLKLFRADIERELRDAGMADRTQQEQALRLTATLVSGDPVTRFMHRELAKELAAKQIRKMARQARIRHIEMFNLLSQRFQAETASYQLGQLHPTPVGKVAYQIRETPGEISQAYFTRLFGSVTGSAAQARAKSGAEGLTGPVENMLDELEQEVKHPSAKVVLPDVPGREELTRKQKLHLYKIEQAETGAAIADAERKLTKHFRTQYKLVWSEAKKVLTRVKSWLSDAPLTITVNGSDWFGRRTKYFKRVKPPRPDTEETRYKPATLKTETKSYQEIFERGGTAKGIKHLPKWVDRPGTPELGKRPETYLRFRTWKDQLMTSLMEFKPKELPTFGALNVNWEMFAGTEKPEAGYGVNTYGDTHFLLDKDKVGSRLVYTATDHGVPRRDPLLAVSDFAFGGSLTELTDVKNESMVNQIVNAALGNAKVVSNLPFEIQIFGTVDIARDLEKIYASPSVSKTVKDNLAAFQKLTGIECEILTPPRDFAAQVIPTHLKRPELLKAALAKQRISSTRVSEVEAEGNEPVRAFKALAYYILKQTPRSKNDKEAMRGALGELTTLLGFLPPAQQTAAIIKLHNDIKDYVVKVAP